MRKDEGFSLIALIISIIIIVVIGVVVFKVVLGPDGLYNQYKDTANEYNKEEIVDKLNLIIKEKYIKDYKYCQENNQNIDEVYTQDAALNYLIESDYIEQLKDINDNPVQDEYYINASSLNSDVDTIVINGNGSASNGTKIYKIKKVDDKFLIYYVDKYGDEEELGELNFKPEV